MLLAAAAILGCKGDAGPTGPTGPQGAQGPPGAQGVPGSLNRQDYTGTIGASGSVSLLLPAASVAGGKVPVVACFISQTGATWLAVAQAPTVATWPFCGLVGIGGTGPAISLVNVPSGYSYYVIAVW